MFRHTYIIKCSHYVKTVNVKLVQKCFQKKSGTKKSKLILLTANTAVTFNFIIIILGWWKATVAQMK